MSPHIDASALAESKLDPHCLNPEQTEFFNHLIEQTDQYFRKYRWNVYDYNDSGLVKTLSKFSDDEFQWEFIRRNEIYRRLWLASELRLGFKKGSASLAKIAEEVFSLVYFADPNIGALDLAKLAKAWEPSEDDFFCPSFINHVAFKRAQRSFRVIYFGETTNPLRFEAPSQFYMKFDGDIKHDEQIEYAKKFLRLHSSYRSTRRSQRNAWPEYIKVLDAHAAGLSYKQIGQLLRKCKNEQSARDSLEAGQRLVFRCATVL